MRIVYALALLFLSGSSCLFVWKVRKEAGLTVYIRRFILCSVAAMSACIVSSYSQIEVLSLVSFGTYFSALAWLLVFFVQFILAYTDNSSRIINGLMIFFAAVATVNTVLNVKYRHGFSVEELNWVTDGNRYLILVPGFWYKFFLGSGFAILAVCVVAMIVKSIETPSAYRPRYLVIIFMVAVTVSLDAAFLVFNIPMDWSALFYTVFAIVAWFFSTRYIKTFLLTGTLAVIVDQMDTGLVTFDYLDTPVYLNERARYMIGAEMEELPEILEKWYGTRKVSGLKNGTREIELTRNGAAYVYSVRFEALKDSAGVYNGGFFALRDITAEKEKERREQYNREHDRMTNLYIQDAFLEKCAEVLRDNPREQYLMIRTENEVFESIRAVYGKDTKDAVIAGLGGIIRKKCYGKGVGGWLKDESFVLLLPVSDFTEKGMVSEVSGSLSEILGQNAEFFRIRTGICPVNERVYTPRLLMEQAKVALGYIMRDKNAVVSWYTEEMRQKGIRDVSLAEEIPAALEKGEMKMYLQPVLGNKGRNVIGAEALIRWHRAGRVLLPGEFLSLLDRNEQIAGLDLFIWEQAVIQLRRWKDGGRKDLFVTLNIAGKDLYLLDVRRELRKLTDGYCVDPTHLHIDVSSEMMSQEMDHLGEIVRGLKEDGFHVNLDNFGSCNTAPVILRDIRFDGIRISRELVHEIESDAAGKSLTESIVEMGRNLGMKVYAAGIETEREFRALRAMNCDGYQGFFISEALPAEEFEQCGFFQDTDYHKYIAL